MRPELFTLPFIHVSIKSYGLMMVLGFLAALWMARRRCLKLRENPLHITNFAVYPLLAGVVGARAMHVMHNWSSFYRHDLKAIFAIWSGGLEFLGGLVLAILVMLVYFKHKKLPILKFLDILAPAAMLGLAFGRVGCLLNGCCYGAPCELPWAIRFPAVNTHTHVGPGCEKVTETRYSNPYDYQLYPDPDNRPEQPTLIELPADYYKPGYREPKPINQLTEQQLQDMQNNLYPMHPIHPSQIYSIGNALLICLLLNLMFRRRKFDGHIVAWMLILYGITRFALEMVRVEPTEWFGLTISQNMGLVALIIGLALLIYLPRRLRRKIAQ